MVSEVGDCGYSLRSRHVSVDNPNLHKSRSGKRRMNSNPKKNHIDKQSGERRHRPARKISNSNKNRIDKIEDTLFRNEDYKEQSLAFANTAICHLYSNDIDVELVKPGLVAGARISGGSIFHFNFKAKRRDYLDAPVKTYFAQFRLMGDRPSNLTMFIDVCVNLGPTHKLPREVHDGGCQFCTTLVFHPKGGSKKLLRGCVNDDVSWLNLITEPGHRRPSWYKYTERLSHSGGSSGSSSDGDV